MATIHDWFEIEDSKKTPKCSCAKMVREVEGIKIYTCDVCRDRLICPFAYCLPEEEKDGGYKED